MVYLLVIGKIISILLLPVLAPLAMSWFEKNKGNDKGWYSNLYIYGLLLAAAAVIVIELYDRQINSPLDSEELEFFNSSDYEKDVNAYLSKQQNSPTASELRELFRKFEFAEYAWEKNDIEEARKALASLSKGKDEQGPLLKIPSALVLNNLGCVWFKIQRNKQFKASNMLFAARNLASPNSNHLDVIESNINKLDTMTNRVD